MSLEFKLMGKKSIQLSGELLNDDSSRTQLLSSLNGPSVKLANGSYIVRSNKENLDILKKISTHKSSDNESNTETKNSTDDKFFTDLEERKEPEHVQHAKQSSKLSTPFKKPQNNKLEKQQYIRPQSVRKESIDSNYSTSSSLSNRSNKSDRSDRSDRSFKSDRDSDQDSDRDSDKSNRSDRSEAFSSHSDSSSEDERIQYSTRRRAKQELRPGDKKYELNTEVDSENEDIVTLSRRIRYLTRKLKEYTDLVK